MVETRVRKSDVFDFQIREAEIFEIFKKSKKRLQIIVSGYIILNINFNTKKFYDWLPIQLRRFSFWRESNGTKSGVV